MGTSSTPPSLPYERPSLSKDYLLGTTEADALDV